MNINIKTYVVFFILIFALSACKTTSGTKWIEIDQEPLADNEKSEFTIMYSKVSIRMQYKRWGVELPGTRFRHLRNAPEKLQRSLSAILMLLQLDQDSAAANEVGTRPHQGAQTVVKFS